MGKIGSWYLKGIAALPGENVVWSKTANRTQSSGRAVGGKLFVTDRRVIFCPHLVDAVTGGQQLILNRSDVASVEKQTKGGDTFGGGLRDRLALHLKDGTTELFVVNDLDSVIQQLQMQF